MVRSGPASVEINEAHHPLCGLLISMHVYGLYNGRYGLSDKIVVDALPTAARELVDPMLEAEQQRQVRLREALSKDPQMQDQIAEKTLFHHYKLLQFFDTLALYFCMEDAAGRQVSTFKNVPRAVGDDVSITVTPFVDGSYLVEPFPFPGNAIDLILPGKNLRPQAPGTDIHAVLQATPKSEESIRLVSASYVQTHTESRDIT